MDALGDPVSTCTSPMLVGAAGAPAPGGPRGPRSTAAPPAGPAVSCTRLGGTEVLKPRPRRRPRPPLGHAPPQRPTPPTDHTTALPQGPAPHLDHAPSQRPRPLQRPRPWWAGPLVWEGRPLLKPHPLAEAPPIFPEEGQLGTESNNTGSIVTAAAEHTQLSHLCTGVGDPPPRRQDLTPRSELSPAKARNLQRGGFSGPLGPANGGTECAVDTQSLRLILEPLWPRFPRLHAERLEPENAFAQILPPPWTG